MNATQREDLVTIEFNLEYLVDSLPDHDPRKADLLAAVRLIGLAAGRS